MNRRREVMRLLEFKTNRFKHAANPEAGGSLLPGSTICFTHTLTHLIAPLQAKLILHLERVLVLPFFANFFLLIGEIHRRGKTRHFNACFLSVDTVLA
jgi:hypothetical protein